MIYLDLTLNLTLLVALTIVSAFIDERWPRHTRAGVLMQGVLFGGAAVLGMLRPVHLGPGVIIDGRSVMISLSALYFGPWVASMASFMTIACRVGIGGVGTVTGVLVIVLSACIGLAARLRLKPEAGPPSTRSLYLFGLAVHLAMLGLMFSLPMSLALHTIERIGFPVLVAYPLATVLAGKILSDRVSTIRRIAQLQQSRQNLHTTLQSIGDAVISTDFEGRVAIMNPASEALTGWRNEEAAGKPLEEVFNIVNEYTRAKVENPVARVLREGGVVGLANHTLLIARDGEERPIADSGAPIRADDGAISGVVLVFRDQTSERMAQKLVRARMDLLEFAAAHPLDEFLSRALDEIAAFVESPIGFYHVLESDQKTLSLQQWSTRTLREFCRAEGQGRHYSIDKAGVWVDCVRERKPVIHNDYSSLEHKKGMPEGHARVVRELVVPVMRNDKIVAVLGVGNKPRDYTEKDVESVAYLADLTWEIVERKRAEKARREREEINNAILNQATEGIVVVDSDTFRFVEFNDAACNGLGYSREEFAQLTLFDVQGIQTRKELTELADRVRKNGSARFENRQRRKDGSLRDVMTSAVGLPDSGRIIALWLDITDRSRMEDALRDEELRLRTILQTVNEGFWLIDNETATIDVNPRMCAILGRNREAILGRKIFDFVDDENKAVFERQIGFRERGLFSSYEIALCRADGSSVFCRFKASPLFDKAGNKAGSFAMVTDITQSKRSEQAQRAYSRFLEIAHEQTEVMELLQEFVAEIKSCTGCDAVGIRVLDENGNIPYQACEGFSPKFYEAESPLCIQSDQCMCINVIRGEVDQSPPFYTKSGSFVMNATSRFLASVSKQEKGQTGNVCNLEGYESVALIPFRKNDRILGLVHVADHRENMVPAHVVQMLEKAALQLGEAFERIDARERLRESEALFRNLFEQHTAVKMIIDPDTGRIVSANDAAQRFYGWSEERLGEMNIWDINALPPEEVKLEMEKARALKRVRFEFKHRLADGALRDVEVFSSKIAVGGKDLLHSIIHDVTEQKQAEDKLRESEMRFLTVFHAGPTPTSLTRFSDGKFLDVNDQFLNLFGYAREEVIGSDPLTLGMWADPEDRAEMIEKLIRQGETGSFETQYVTKNGEIKDVLVVARLINIAGEQYILGLSTDITGKKRAQEEVLRLYRQNQLILDATAEGIVGVDLAGKIVFVNPSAAHMLGYSIEELIGADLHELAHHSRPDGSPYPPDECLTFESMRTGSGSRLEDEWFWRKNGKSFPCVLSSTPIKEDGKILGAVVSFQDITARKRAQEEKERLETHLRQAQRLESIGTLAGGIAHDFNNILAPIMGYAEMALAETPQADSRRFGQEQILGAALRARDLVSQILAFSRSGTGQRQEPVEIGSLVKEALKLIRASLPSSIEIQHRIESAVANVDPTQIHQVLMNLCTNAAHAMGEEGILEVGLSRVDLSERDLADQLLIDLKPGPHLKLCVSDTGPGMDQATLGRIFDPYFTTKTVGKGTGLGLFVVSGIVKQHQGAVTVESEVGAGATFTVYLPAIEDETANIDGPAPAPKTGTERILLVDDEQVVVKMAAKILQGLGYTVTGETDAGRAVKVFKADPAGFDLVITDYAMPRLTGLDLAVTIRKIRPGMPVILSTGFTERATVDRSNALGLEILMKPYSVTQLSEMVRKVLDLQDR